MEAEVDGFRARRHVVRTAEGGQEIVNSCFVGEVDDGKSQTPFVTITVEEIVVANRKIKEISRLNAWRILVVVFGSGRRDSSARKCAAHKAVSETLRTCSGAVLISQSPPADRVADYE